MWGLMWGFPRGGRQADQMPCEGAMEDGAIEESDVSACAGHAVARLGQTQLRCPLDRPPSAIDVELAVNGLGMGANRA